MEGTPTCARCGAPLSTGRFCTNCGAPITAAPNAPSYDDTSTQERLAAVPDEPPAPWSEPPPPTSDEPPRQAPPLFRDEVRPPPPVAPAVSESLRFDESPAQPTTHRRSSGAVWAIGAAVGLITVLVIGAFLLLNGGGDDHPSAASSPKAQPGSHHTKSTPPPSSGSASASASASASGSTGARTEVAGLSTASAPAHAPAGVDFAGRPVTFVAPNMVDGIVDTCWRTPGDATNMVLTFRLDRPTKITKVGLINGYAKTAVSGGRTYDWYQGDRRVLAVSWIFDDGSTVDQQFSQTRAMQSRGVPPVTTSTVRVKITSVSATGRGPAARNDTAISEVSLIGSPT